jgi:hypothetical protein
MNRFLAAAIELVDLGATAEAVCKHDVARSRRSDGGQEDLLGAGLGDFEVPGLEPEVPGKSAAARVESFDGCSGCFKQLSIGVPSENGVLMTVHLR